MAWCPNGPDRAAADRSVHCGVRTAWAVRGSPAPKEDRRSIHGTCHGGVRARTRKRRGRGRRNRSAAPRHGRGFQRRRCHASGDWRRTSAHAWLEPSSRAATWSRSPGSRSPRGKSARRDISATSRSRPTAMAGSWCQRATRSTTPARSSATCAPKGMVVWQRFTVTDPHAAALVLHERARDPPAPPAGTAHRRARRTSSRRSPLASPDPRSRCGYRGGAYDARR